MNDNEIVKAWKKILATGDAPVGEHWSCGGVVTTRLAKETYDMLTRQKAEIERLQKLQKPTETSGFKIQNGKVVFYTNILNGYRHEYKDLEEVVKELNLMLQSCYKCDEVVSHYKGNLKIAKSEAIKEFAERLKKKKEVEFVQNFGLAFQHERVDVADIDNLVKEMTNQLTRIEHDSLCETETYKTIKERF